MTHYSDKSEIVCLQQCPEPVGSAAIPPTTKVEGLLSERIVMPGYTIKITLSIVLWLQSHKFKVQSAINC